MSAIVILLGSLVLFVLAYVFYGSWLAKQWGVDPTRVTPAHTMEDGVDYIPAKSPVLLGHHFASIAGAGPINGPIQAAIFGWVPVLLWIVIGGIFFGAVQDFSSIFVSIRHQGKSLGEVIEENIGHKCKILFTIFAWLVLILVVAAFSDIVAGTFVGVGPNIAPATATANGSVATASLLFIPLAMCFGVVNRKKIPLFASTIVGVLLLVVCIAIGLYFPIYLSKSAWLVFVFTYIFIASVTPVWILLQPRDYLNSFLLYFMMIAAVIGIIGANPTIIMKPFTSWNVGGSTLFPFLFITVACGAISGFHSLIGSGTTSKQLDNEKDAKMIGYGGMLIECFLAVIALIVIGSLSVSGAYKEVGTTPAIIFATGIKGFFIKIGMGEMASSTAYTVICLSISAFALTSLDTATRLGRFLFQELFAGNSKENKNAVQKVLSNMYVATLITIFFGALLCLGGYANIWPLFGACNQLVAVPAFLAVTVWLARQKKNNKMFYFPMIFMLCATLSSLVISFMNNMKKFEAGTAVFIKEGLQCIITVPIFVLAVILVIEGVKVLIQLNNEKKTNA